MKSYIKLILKIYEKDINIIWIKIDDIDDRIRSWTYI